MNIAKILYHIEHLHATKPPDKKLLARQIFARPVLQSWIIVFLPCFLV
jgi:hypothetical protein